MEINLNSTIAILGGAGKTGRPLVEEILTAGYRVRLLLRHPEAFDLTSERMEIIPGDARDPASVRALLQGCAALLSTLGHPKGEPTPITAAVTKILITTAGELGIKRYVVVSSLFTTGEEKHDPETKQAAAFMQKHFPLMMDDRRLEFQLLLESRLDWTYVRVPYIIQNPAVGGVKVNLDHLPGPRIRATDLARFLVDQLNDRRYIRQSPFVASDQPA